MSAIDSDRADALQLIPVSRETERRLELFLATLARWHGVKNLVGPAERSHIWMRHIADSLQLFRLATGARRWLDLGSGAGFPGLVIGILLAEQEAGTVNLIETNARKCAFLQAAARSTGARVQVRQCRIEDVIGRYAGEVEVVTARALAPLPKLIAWTKDLLRTGAIGIFPKGQDVDAELTETAKYWSIDMDQVPSLTDPRGRILIVRGAEPRYAP